MGIIGQALRTQYELALLVNSSDLFPTCKLQTWPPDVVTTLAWCARCWVHVTGKLTVQLDTEHGAGAGAGRVPDPEKKQFITGIREL